MPLSDIIDVQIVTTGPAVSAAGFGTPLILSTHNYFADRVRFYSDLAGMTSDGFTASDPTYLQASLIFAQNPRPQQVAVGKRNLLPTQRWALTPAVANNTLYQVKVGASTVSYTSDATATATEIIAGLKTAIDALGLALTTTDQTTFLRVVATVAGAFFEVESKTPSTLALAQDHADPGVATDLAAIQLVDDSWYAVVNPFNSRAELAAIAAWVEGQLKLFLATTQDTAVMTAAYDATGAADVGSDLHRLNYARTALMYHPNSASFAGAAWAGKCLPLDPGSETWKFKTLGGVAATTLTATQRNNLRAKFVNWYETLAGVSVTQDGVVSDAEFIDVIRGRDWLQARLREDLFSRLVNARKLPFTDAGIAVIEAAVRARLKNAVDVGFLASNPAPTVTVPLAANVSQVDKANRYLANVLFDATIAGAIHKLQIKGRVSL